MRTESLQCIYIDHETQAPATYTSFEDVNPLLRTSRLGQTIGSILESFSSVRVCSSPTQLRELLDKTKNDTTYHSTCFLVSLPKIETITPAYAAQEQLTVAKDIDLLDSMSSRGIPQLNGIDLLRFLILYIRCSRLQNVYTAVLSANPDLQSQRMLSQFGSVIVIADLRNTADLKREILVSGYGSVEQLYLASTQTPQSRLNIKLDPSIVAVDPAKYEKEDLRPSKAHWEGLRERAQALIVPTSRSAIYDLVDMHMPAYESLLIPGLLHHANETFFNQIPRLQQLVSSWEFSTLELGEEELINCAAVMFKHLFSLPGTEDWYLTDEALFSFIENVRRSYHVTNPYHNFRHAIDVLQAVFYMLLSAGSLPAMNEDCPKFAPVACPVLPVLMTAQYMLGACIVGIGHDVGHPGVNNAFLVATKAPLAQLYNDRSVLESMHCAALSRILTRNWPSTQSGSMRKVIIELIFSTDMALHFDYMSKFKEMESICMATREAATQNTAPAEPVEIPPATLEKYKITLFSALIKCGDISNVARPFAISREWSHVLLKEFFNQARLEKALGLPVTKNFDPEQTAQADSQAFFMNLFAIPLFSSLEKVLPNLVPIRLTIDSNHDRWTAKGNTDNQPIPAKTSVITDENSLLAEPLAKSTQNGTIVQEDMHLNHNGGKVESEAHLNASEVQNYKNKKGFSLPKLFKRKKSGVEA